MNMKNKDTYIINRNEILERKSYLIFSILLLLSEITICINYGITTERVMLISISTLFLVCICTKNQIMEVCRIVYLALALSLQIFIYYECKKDMLIDLELAVTIVYFAIAIGLFNKMSIKIAIIFVYIAAMINIAYFVKNMYLIKDRITLSILLSRACVAIISILIEITPALMMKIQSKEKETD